MNVVVTQAMIHECGNVPHDSAIDMRDKMLAGVDLAAIQIGIVLKVLEVRLVKRWNPIRVIAIQFAVESPKLTPHHGVDREALNFYRHSLTSRNSEHADLHEEDSSQVDLGVSLEMDG